MTYALQVHLPDGSTLTCQNESKAELEIDAELVLDAYRRHHEGNTSRKLPRRTLALERAGCHAANSMLYRSVMDKLADE